MLPALLEMKKCIEIKPVPAFRFTASSTPVSEPVLVTRAGVLELPDDVEELLEGEPQAARTATVMRAPVARTHRAVPVASSVVRIPIH